MNVAMLGHEAMDMYMGDEFNQPLTHGLGCPLGSHFFVDEAYADEEQKEAGTTAAEKTAATTENCK